jgi:hypothetical protein
MLGQQCEVITLLLTFKSQLEANLVDISTQTSSVKQTTESQLDTSSQDMSETQTKTTLIVNLGFQERRLVQHNLATNFNGNVRVWNGLVPNSLGTSFNIRVYLLMV